jgi:exosortase
MLSLLTRISPRLDTPQSQRHLQFALLLLASFVLLYGPIEALVRLSYLDRRYTYIFLVPPLTIWLLWRDADHIFSSARKNLGTGLPLMLAGAVLLLAVLFVDSSFAKVDALALAIAGAVMVWIGGFFLCYGTQAARAALFPLAFFLMIIPPPANLLDAVTLVLQKFSADASYAIFTLIGVPVFREGFVFSLPGVDIEVAEECSGVGSSISLLISGILAGHLFLRFTWTKLILAVLTIPIAIFRNAVRIVVISWLGVYVDDGFFYGSLHEHGATPASLLGLAILAWALLSLRKLEGRADRGQGAAPQNAASVPGAR